MYTHEIQMKPLSKAIRKKTAIQLLRVWVFNFIRVDLFVDEKLYGTQLKNPTSWINRQGKDYYELEQ